MGFDCLHALPGICSGHQTHGTYELWIFQMLHFWNLFGGWSPGKKFPAQANKFQVQALAGEGNLLDSVYRDLWMSLNVLDFCCVSFKNLELENASVAKIATCFWQLLAWCRCVVNSLFSQSSIKILTKALLIHLLLTPELTLHHKIAGFHLHPHDLHFGDESLLRRRERHWEENSKWVGPSIPKCKSWMYRRFPIWSIQNFLQLSEIKIFPCPKIV